VQEIGDAERGVDEFSPLDIMDPTAKVFDDLKYYGVLDGELTLTGLGHIVYRRLKASLT
jgi:hypothetical protein